MTADVVSVVQARMGSTRRPGKVMADLGGQPMLAFMLRRLLSGGGDIGTLVLATSTGAIDDPVAELGESLGVTVVRGSEADVLSRFAEALRVVPAKTVVRLTADCPLQDPALIAAAVAHHHDVGADYTSNSLVRTFPKGLDVEVVRADLLLEAEREAVDHAEREHVTPFFYRRPERFSLAAFRNDELLGDEWWTVDTPEDLEHIRSIVASLPSPFAGWREILSTVGRRAVPQPGALWLRVAYDSEPGARSWDVYRDDDIVGRVRIPVANGVGVLECNLPNEVYAEVVHLLRTTLAGDVQLRELQTPS